MAVGAACMDDVVLYFDGFYFMDDCMMGMSPNIIMTMYDLCVYDIVGLCTCVICFPRYFIIYCGAVKLWGNANTHLQGISLKVPEHDEELSQVH